MTCEGFAPDEALWPKAAGARATKAASAVVISIFISNLHSGTGKPPATIEVHSSEGFAMKFPLAAAQILRP
jgi:hypothetical protein